MSDVCHQNGVQRVAVDVGIVAEHSRGCRRERGVLIHVVAVRGRHRRIVHIGHRHVDRRGVGTAMAVRDRVGKGVRSEEIMRRCVGRGTAVVCH